MSSLPEIALEAKGFAMCAHRNQRRKYEDAPYIVHCERVARLVGEYTSDANAIAAALQSQGSQLRRQSEDDVGRGEKLAAPCLKPAFPGTGLTLRAMPVSAAVVRDGGAMSTA
jgi:hypothetical protein